MARQPRVQGMAKNERLCRVGAGRAPLRIKSSDKARSSPAKNFLQIFVEKSSEPLAVRLDRLSRWPLTI